MSVIWELQLGADRRPLRAWGLRSAIYTRRSFASDTLELRAPGLSITAAPLFPADSTVVLWRAGVRAFTGRITNPEVYGGARQQGHAYVASGPWWFLENLRYQEERFMAVDPSDPNSALVRVFSPRAVLFNTLTGGQQTAAQQVQQAIAFANSRGAGITLGEVGLAVQPPWEEASSISVAEVIKRSARYAPDAVQWLNYASAKPTFRIGRRASLDVATLDLGDTNRVEVLEGIRPLTEARPPGVRFFYEDVVVRADGSTRARYRQQSAGNPDAVGGINEVIELGGQGGTNPEPMPEGLAAAYYAAVSVLNYGGTLRLKGRDVVGDIAPGRRLNLLGGRPEWATMGATVQVWRGDLLAGAEEITLGQPPFLGAQAFVEYLRYSRLRQKSSYLDARRTGEGSTSAVPARALPYFFSAGGENKGFVEIELCGDNSSVPPKPAKTIKIFAETISTAELPGGGGGGGGA